MKRDPITNKFVIKFANVNGTRSASANSLFSKGIFRMGIRSRDIGHLLDGDVGVALPYVERSAFFGPACGVITMARSG